MSYKSTGQINPKKKRVFSVVKNQVGRFQVDDIDITKALFGWEERNWKEGS